MLSKLKGMKIIEKQTSFKTPICIEDKMYQSRNHFPDTKATFPLELIYTDLTGAISASSREH